MKTVTNVIPIEEIFGDITLIGETPNLILKAQMPDRIFDDVKSWIEPCRSIKDDDYAELLSHINVGTGYNSYQTGIPRRFIDNSFFLGYLIRFGEIYLDTTNIPNAVNNRRVHLRNYPGHFDGYDIWMNFAYEGDSNPQHNHAGSLSGIIYIQDEDNQPTHFPLHDYVHHPKAGEILLFPAHLLHFVEEKKTECERITASFNLDVY